MPDASPSLRLITFAPMVGSEVTRLLLRHYDVRYVERDHLFGWASVISLLHGGRGAIPILCGNGPTKRGARTIADHFEPLAHPARRLLPETDAAAVEADWQTLYGQFKADIAIFAYYHLLPERAMMVPVFAKPLSAIEARLTGLLYPALSAMFRLLLRLNAANAADAGARILDTLHSFDARLYDGRRFLTGEKLTLGDIALAGACAPLLQPEGFGTVMPLITAMPAPMRDLIAAMRDTRAARCVEAVYADL